MGVIDADTHIDETEDTWEWLEASEEAFRPTTGYPSNPDPSLPPRRFRHFECRPMPAVQEVGEVRRRKNDLV